jgi:hypothetical protein
MRMSLKFSLKDCQALDLLRIGARRNLQRDRNQPVLKEHIMNQIHLAARVAQGLLAVTIVFAIGVVIQLSLVY